jgi:hypothetical protein
MLKLPAFVLTVKPSRALTAKETEQAKAELDKLVEAAVCAYVREHKSLSDNPYLPLPKR